MTSDTAAHTTPGVSLRTTIALTVGVAALWVVVALLRPDTTLHLGPVLVPLVPLLLARREDHAIAATLVASAISVATAIGLAASGNLDGPALTPFPNALVESLAGAAIGTAIALVGIRSAR